ncbi:MAG: hypothetical protein R2909_08210 [Gemmatimonadales bacterium]
MAPPSLELLTYLGPWKVNPLGEIGFDSSWSASAEPDARPRSERTKLVARGMSPSIRCSSTRC